MYLNNFIRNINWKFQSQNGTVAKGFVKRMKKESTDDYELWETGEGI